MTILERLTLRLTDNGVAPDANILNDCIETAKNAILSRRFPYTEWPTREVETIVTNTVTTVNELTGEPETQETTTTVTTEETFVEPRYQDLQFRIAMDLYNRIGVEGETMHSENGISRHYDSSWISTELLEEVVPYCGVVR